MHGIIMVISTLSNNVECLFTRFGSIEVGGQCDIEGTLSSTVSVLRDVDTHLQDLPLTTRQGRSSCVEGHCHSCMCGSDI